MIDDIIAVFIIVFLITAIVLVENNIKNQNYEVLSYYKSKDLSYWEDVKKMQTLGSNERSRAICLYLKAKNLSDELRCNEEDLQLKLKWYIILNDERVELK